MDKKIEIANNRAIFENDIPGVGKLVTYRMPYLEALEKMSKQNIHVASIEDIARAKIITGVHSDITQGRYNVKEGCINLPSEKKRILLRESLTLTNPLEAYRAHKEKREYMPAFNLDEYLEKIGKENYFIVQEDTYVLANDFDTHPLTKWLLQGAAKEYGELVNEFGGKGITASGDFAYMRNYQEQNSANRLIFEYINIPRTFNGTLSHGINNLDEYDEERNVLTRVYPSTTGIKLSS